ncbi:MAG: lipid-A-disaccharide synthase [Leptospiraceae bacterium]|nr:lipid-A-disaccharide synthase [Leptospiraceae bacterium]MDW8306823.1 lipid-A-disaccharide synthase [Leptospiraceae bacterium]
MKLKKNVKKNILIVAGETSGDRLGQSILKELSLRKGYVFFGVGGDGLKDIGVELLYSTKDLSVVGIVEILFSFFRLKKIMSHLVRESVRRQVSHAVLIDFPGFNLRLARKLSQLGISCYLIASPQIWAWRYKRIYKIKKYIRSVFCFYDFEVEIYKRENIKAFFVGHPLVKEWKKYRKKEDKNLIAILPGSRPLEIKKLMPFFIALIKRISERNENFFFVIPAASSHIMDLLKLYKLPPKVRLSSEPAASVLSRAYAAFACSGTVTLECAFFQVPFFLVYKASYLSYWIALTLVKINHIGMPNILAGREIVPELWQHEVRLAKAWPLAEKILFDELYRQKMKQDLAMVARKLGDGSSAEKIAYELEKEFRL